MIMENGSLYITKGADEIYLLDEVKDQQGEVILSAYQSGCWDNLAADQSYTDILKKLERAGVICREVFKAERILKYAVKYFGTANDKLAGALENMSVPNAVLTHDGGECDLLLLVRTNVPMKQVLENYESVQIPHMFVDLAYANIVSLGPLVHKKDTACLGCFVGRLAVNWGDPPPPEEPAVTAKTDLITALIQEKVAEYAEYGNCPDLINNAWSFNVKRFTSGYDRVHKLPWCPECGSGKEKGAIDLPWGEGR